MLILSPVVKSVPPRRDTNKDVLGLLAPGLTTIAYSLPAARNTGDEKKTGVAPPAFSVTLISLDSRVIRENGTTLSVI